MSPQPPRAARNHHLVVRHGQAYDDPYAWLRDAAWREVLRRPAALAPEIRAYLEAENAYREAAMRDTEPLQEQLLAELKGRIKEDDAAVPLKDGAFEYYTRHEVGRQYPLHCRRRLGGAGAAEEVLLDVNELARGHEFCKVGLVQHAPDHARIVYTVDFAGSERFEVRVRELADGRDRPAPDVITDAGPHVAWGADSRTLYYLLHDEHHRHKWCKRHRLGDARPDETLYEEPDDGFFLSIDLSESQAFVTLRSGNHTCSEWRILPAADPTAPFALVEPRRPGTLYELAHSGDVFYVILREGAQKDGTLLTAPKDAPQRASWRPLVPYESGRLIESMLIFSDYLVRLESADALPRIVVRRLADGDEHTVAFDEAAYHLTLVHGFEFATTTLRFTYSSMTTPERTFDYDMATRQRVLRKEQEIPSGHDPSRYEIHRLYAPARDGAQIPVTLLKRRDVPLAGGAPLLLYGYGSYGISMPASFSPHRLSLVDRGVSYAIAHVRGGKDKGYAWYESAKLGSKRRTFDDFIDAGRFLVQRGITRAGRIVGHGGSAGGMLMGAVANMAPDLFLGIVADVPFVDVLNTMWDKDLPLTPPEWPEWGNPIEDPAAHAYIASYSPYDNVERKDYPHLLVLAGLTDPRVTYWEPAKWVARLRELKTDDRLLLFDVNMGAGHAGASGRFDVLKKVAMIYAFVLKVAGSAQ